MAYLRAYQAKGDPFLGGLISKIGKGVVGAARGLLGIPAMPGVGKVAVRAGEMVGKFPGGKKGAAIAGGALAAGALGGMMGDRMSMGGGGRSYRRQNVGNVKALRRAMRRVQGFAKLANSTMSFTRTHRMKKRRRK